MTFKGQTGIDQWESRAIYLGTLVLGEKNWKTNRVLEKNKVHKTEKKWAVSQDGVSRFKEIGF